MIQDIKQEPTLVLNCDSALGVVSDEDTRIHFNESCVRALEYRKPFQCRLTLCQDSAPEFTVPMAKEQGS